MERVPSERTCRSILVTGASGFVGRTLCAQLVASGCSVRGTILPTERPASLAAGVEPVIVEPLAPDTPWAHALAGVDTVIHLAARVHMMDEQAADPLAEFRRVNTEGTRRLAAEAARAGVKRLVFTSSIKVNGEEAAEPYSEESPARPTDPYGISKWEAEQALRELEAGTGLEVVAVRPTLVYGPGVTANFLKMMKAVGKGIPLPLGSIANRRSLIYVGNLADALAVCASHPGAAGETFLVSDGKDVSTPELLRLTAKALGAPERVFPFPTPLMRVAGALTGKSPQVSRLTGSLAVDSSRIRRKLGWRPPFSMEAGLKATAEWFIATGGDRT
jgi:nucleoside-diphosphate-sugar epimerase